MFTCLFIVSPQEDLPSLMHEEQEGIDLSLENVDMSHTKHMFQVVMQYNLNYPASY